MNYPDFDNCQSRDNFIKYALKNRRHCQVSAVESIPYYLENILVLFFESKTSYIVST